MTVITIPGIEDLGSRIGIPDRRRAGGFEEDWLMRLDLKLSESEALLGGEWAHMSRGVPVRGIKSDPNNHSIHDNSSSMFKSTELLGALATAFAHHLPVALRPEVIWSAILHEVGLWVNKDPCAHAAWFTSKPSERILIEIADASVHPRVPKAEQNWAGAVTKFADALQEYIPSQVQEMFLPNFSTSDPEARAALTIGFMDVVQSYYSFTMMSMCGIPRIKLEGTPEDWQLIVTRTAALSEMFQGLSPWFADLLPVLKKVAATAAGTEQDLDF